MQQGLAGKKIAKNLWNAVRDTISERSYLVTVDKKAEFG
jgi:hypothetical protein